MMRYFRNGVEIRNKSAVGGKTYDLVSDADIESEQAEGDARGESELHRPRL